MNKLDLSIIIASYNTKDITVACIKSIQKYKYQFSYEIIVVDDASNDGSVEVLKKTKNIKLFLNSKNSGYVKTNNKGMSNASGEYILLLNSDTIVEKESIQKLLSFAKKTNNSGVVGARLLNMDGSVQPSCYYLPSVLNAIKNKTEMFYPKGDSPSVVDGVVGAVFLITPQAKSKVGLLNEKYISYYEDIDYCRRVNENGLKVYYLPSSTFYHHHGASFKKLSDSKNQWKKLIPSSKIYNGFVGHYLIFVIMWIRQKLGKLFNLLTINK